MNTGALRPSWAPRLATSLLLAAALVLAGVWTGGNGLAAASAASTSPCTAVSLNAPATVAASGSVALAATASCGSAPSYAFFARPNSTVAWTLIRGWGRSSFVASAANGWVGDGYQFLAWATDGPLTVPQVQAEQQVSVTPAAAGACTAVSVAAGSNSVSSGQTVNLQATSTCPNGALPEYSYFTKEQSATSWTLQAAWIGPQWSWTAPAAPGEYQVLAWVSDGPYTVPQAQQATTVFDGVPSTCTALSLQATSQGSSVLVTASSTCPAGSNPEYSYFVGPTASGPWTLADAWVGPTWTWDAPTDRYVLVWASNGPYTVPQVQTSIAAPANSTTTAACSAVTASLSSGSNADPQAGMTIAAAAICPDSAPTSYSYFTGPTSAGPWTLQDAWVGSSWTWTPPTSDSGIYYVVVWATDGPLTVPQVQTRVAVPLGSAAECSSVSLTSEPAASAEVGSNVTLAATASCPAGAQPEFAYFTGPSSSGPWSLQDGWTGASWSWDTTGIPSGTEYVLAWVSDGPFTVPQAQSAISLTLEPNNADTLTPGSNPSYNLSPDYVGACWSDGYSSLGCQQTEIADIDSALASEGLSPLTWNSALYSLPLAEQSFVVTNEERIARGLPPLAGMASQADANALVGALAMEDPPTEQVPGEVAAVGNWAEDYGALGSDFDWMYNDGPGTFNVDCPTAGSSGCWIHRDDILANVSSAPAGYTWVAGAACTSNSSLNYLSVCDLEFVLVPSAGISYDFTWAQAVALGAPPG